MPCPNGFEFSGPETTASEVIVVYNFRINQIACNFLFGFKLCFVHVSRYLKDTSQQNLDTALRSDLP